MIVLFPHERITRPNDVREHVRTHQPDCGIAPAAESVPAVMPLGPGPVDDRPIPLPTPVEPPAPAAANGCEVGPGFPPAAS
jgi:hypothetical protein